MGKTVEKKSQFYFRKSLPATLKKNSKKYSSLIVRFNNSLRKISANLFGKNEKIKSNPSKMDIFETENRFSNDT